MKRFRWKNQSLALKLSVTTTLLVVVAVIGVSLLSIERERLGFEKELETQARVILATMETVIANPLYDLNIDFLESASEALADSDATLRARIFDQTGRTITDSSTEDQLVFNLDADPFGEQIVQQDEIIFIWSADQLQAGKPVTVGRQVIGAIDITLPTSSLITKTQAAMQQSIFIAALVGSIGMLIAIIISRTITNPVRSLNEDASRVAQGDYSHRTVVRSSDEIGQLSQSFNQMAEAIEYRDKEQIAELERRLVEIDSSRKKAEQSDRIKSAFLASMSHELRTPLNSVINFTKFVIRGVMGPVNERQEETLAKVVNSGQHLLSLINDVLDMSKIEAGSLNLFIEENINFNEILDMAISQAEGLLVEKDVTLQQEIEASLPPMKGDRKRLLQIVLNVLSNACKFTEEGSVQVRAYREEQEILIAVQDTGPGIDPEDRDNVFDSFKQTNTGLRQGNGTGLGMPITRSLAEAHGGRLWFESEVGKGSTFYIALPMTSELVPTPA